MSSLSGHLLLFSASLHALFKTEEFNKFVGETILLIMIYLNVILLE